MVTGNVGVTMQELELTFIAVCFPSLPSNISKIVARVKALGFGAGVSGNNVGEHGYRGGRKTVGGRFIIKQARPDLVRLGNVSIPAWQWRVAIAQRNIRFVSDGAQAVRVIPSDKAYKPAHARIHGTPHNMGGQHAIGHVPRPPRYTKHFQMIRNVANVHLEN